MGYTHYFPQTDTVNQSDWKAFTDDVQKILDTTDVKISWESDQPARVPQVDGTVVRFNGTDLGDDEGHETFWLPRVLSPNEWETDGGSFIFCKTARKPYDVVVTAVLCIVNEQLPQFKITSDGYPEEWLEGVALAEKALGRKVRNPIEQASNVPQVRATLNVV